MNTIKNSQCVLVVAVICCVLLTLPNGAKANTIEYEKAAYLKVEDIIPTSLLKSNIYTIDAKVINDGLMNTYYVRSIYGNSQVFSTSSLYKLLAELESINEMKKVEKTDTFAESLKESGKNTVEGIKGLIGDPEASLKGAGRGISNLFSRAKESVQHRSQGGTEDSRVEQLMGFSQSKREVAQKFHVDVYSTNQVLQKQLETLAWAEYAGGLSLSIATMPLGGPLKVVYSSSNAVRLLNNSIAMSPPSELKKQNRAKMGRMRINSHIIDMFLANPYLSPRQQTYIVAAMESLAGTDGLEVIPLVGLHVKDYEMAAAVTRMVLMYAGYNKNVGKFSGFYTIERGMGARTADGSLVILIPVDYLTWNKTAAIALSTLAAAKSKDKKNEVWLLGKATDAAVTNYGAMGWHVKGGAAHTLGLNEVGIPKN